MIVVDISILTLQLPIKIFFYSTETVLLLGAAFSKTVYNLFKPFRRTVTFYCPFYVVLKDDVCLSRYYSNDVTCSTSYRSHHPLCRLDTLLTHLLRVLYRLEISDSLAALSMGVERWWSVDFVTHCKAYDGPGQ